MKITDFLLARIAEDEQRAWNSTELLMAGGQWAGTVARGLALAAPATGLLVQYPPQALAECEAKRRIVERCVEGCECHASGDEHGVGVNWDRDILLLLAEPYAKHPDYQQTWRFTKALR